MHDRCALRAPGPGKSPQAAETAPEAPTAKIMARLENVDHVLIGYVAALSELCEAHPLLV